MSRNTAFRLVWVILFSFCLYGFIRKDWSWIVFIILFVIFIATTAWGSFDLRLQFFSPVIFKGKTSDAKLALTFDDGPTPYTLQVLDILKKHNFKATFFCIGNQVQKHPEIALEILKQGHTIGNHTLTHTSKMGFLPYKEIKKEISENSKILQSVLNINPQWFRPPFGVTNPTIAKVIKEEDLTCIGWNIRSLDTVSKSSEEIVERVKRKLKPNGIVLMHDTSQLSVSALEQLLLEIKKQEFAVVPLQELILELPYKDEKVNPIS